MRWIIFIAVIWLSSCASTKLPNSSTASERFSVLSGPQKAVAREFYDLGSGDAVRRLYWGQRAAQQSNGLSEADPPTKLQRRYVNVPVPEHVEPDGTVKEASNITVETVQFWSLCLH